jgi:hypothetical protein
LPDGALASKYRKPGVIVFEHPSGATVTQFPNGRRETTGPDGARIVTFHTTQLTVNRSSP